MSTLELFGTVFGVILIAELPDKTALAALVLATRHRAAPVFLGAASALTVQSVVAVAAGSLLAELPHEYVRIGSGALFLVCTIII
jgi:Ca2+/H+ antiporter, TMEM165/GDT1 family